MGGVQRPCYISGRWGRWFRRRGNRDFQSETLTASAGAEANTHRGSCVHVLWETLTASAGAEANTNRLSLFRCFLYQRLRLTAFVVSACTASTQATAKKKPTTKKAQSGLRFGPEPIPLN